MILAVIIPSITFINSLIEKSPMNILAIISFCLMIILLIAVGVNYYFATKKKVISQ